MLLRGFDLFAAKRKQAINPNFELELDLDVVDSDDPIDDAWEM